MFRKLVSNLPFSPALLHDVGFYAKRLRKEELTRRLTVLFVALALIMQSLAVFSPPESANASSEQDIIRGGVTSIDDFLLRYDHDEDDLKDILTTIGITRGEIAASKSGSVTTAHDTYVLTRYGQFGASADEASLSYQKSTGGVGTRYFSPLRDVSGGNARLAGWVGHSATVGWFAIVKSNGSIATQGLPKTVSAGDSSAAAIKKSISAVNLTQGSAMAVNNLAEPLDKIAYTISATNTSPVTTTTTFAVQLSDALEYTTLIDGGGGTVDNDTKSLSWQQTQLRPGETQKRTFVMQLLSPLPSTPVGQSNPSSYDCTITMVFGTDLRVPVDCPVLKGAESLIGHLPSTGAMINVVFAVGLALVVLYFYARTRQLKKEIRIIRHDLNTGII